MQVVGRTVEVRGWKKTGLSPGEYGGCLGGVSAGERGKEWAQGDAEEELVLIIVN